jgi:hypothetical protein
VSISEDRFGGVRLLRVSGGVPGTRHADADAGCLDIPVGDLEVDRIRVVGHVRRTPAQRRGNQQRSPRDPRDVGSEHQAGRDAGVHRFVEDHRDAERRPDVCVGNQRVAGSDSEHAGRLRVQQPQRVFRKPAAVDQFLLGVREIVVVNLDRIVARRGQHQQFVLSRRDAGEFLSGRRIDDRRGLVGNRRVRVEGHSHLVRPVAVGQVRSGHREEVRIDLAHLVDRSGQGFAGQDRLGVRADRIQSFQCQTVVFRVGVVVVEHLNHVGILGGGRLGQKVGDLLAVLDFAGSGGRTEFADRRSRRRVQLGPQPVLQAGHRVGQRDGHQVARGPDEAVAIDLAQLDRAAGVAARSDRDGILARGAQPFQRDGVSVVVRVRVVVVVDLDHVQPGLLQRPRDVFLPRRHLVDRTAGRPGDQRKSLARRRIVQLGSRKKSRGARIGLGQRNRHHIAGRCGERVRRHLAGQEDSLFHVARRDRQCVGTGGVQSGQGHRVLADVHVVVVPDQDVVRPRRAQFVAVLVPRSQHTADLVARLVIQNRLGNERAEGIRQRQGNLDLPAGGVQLLLADPELMHIHIAGGKDGVDDEPAELCQQVTRLQRLQGQTPTRIRAAPIARPALPMPSLTRLGN